MEDQPLHPSELETSNRSGIQIEPQAGGSLIRSQLARINTLTRDLKEKELRISQLQDKAAAIESLRQENDQLRSQLQLFAQKTEQAERDAFAKTKALLDSEKSLRPSVQRYQLENEEMKIKSNGLTDQLRLSRQELENRDNIIVELRRDLTAKESILDLKLQENSSLEGQVQSLKAWIARQQDHAGRNSQVLGEKGKLISELELSNAKLREELERSRKLLKDANEELTFIPKLRHELRQCEFLISTASKELDREKTDRAQILKEKEELETNFDLLKQRLSDKSEQNTFLKGLQTRLNESRETYSQLEFSLSSYEERQKETDLKIKKGKKIMRVFLEGLLTWMETYFFSRTSVAMTHIPKAPRTIEGFPELTPLFVKLREKVEQLRIQALEYTVDLEKSYKSLTLNHDKFEHSTTSLKKQVERLTFQVDQQAELHQALLTEKDLRDRDLAEKADQIHVCKSEFERMRQELSSIRDEVAVACSNLDYALQECIRLGYVPAKPKGSDLTSIVTDIKEAILVVGKELRDKSQALEEAKGLGARDREEVEKLTEEYGRRIKDLDVQVERLTLAVDEREKEASEVFQKYQYCYSELTHEQAKFKSADQQRKARESELTGVIGVAEFLLRVLYPLMVRCQLLRQTKNYFIKRNNAYHFGIMECLKSINKPPSSPIAKFRTVAWAVVSLVRMGAKKKVDDSFRYNGLTLKIEKAHIPSQVILSAAEEQGSNFIYPLIMAMEKALMEETGSIMPKYPVNM